jgi:hypothetical protein
MRSVGINLLSQFLSAGKPIQEGHPIKFNLEKSLLILMHCLVTTFGTPFANNLYYPPHFSVKRGKKI